jgi:hypothetical protein
MHGNGVLKFDDGVQINGRFENGHALKGEITWKSESVVYEGSFNPNTGMFEGQG